MLFLRFITLVFSVRNEKRLKKHGAVEYGKFNTTLLIVLHILIYLASFTEGIIKNVQFDNTTIVGLFLYTLSTLALVLVIYQIKDVWTVKLLLAKKHKLNKSFIFKYIRHPNYFLNIIPELVGIAMIFKSWIIFTILFPVYLIFLVIRIIQEEKLMKLRFPNY